MADHDYFDDTKPTTFKVDRNSSYAKKTKKGFRGDYWNSHHVVPCGWLKKSLDAFLEGKHDGYKRALGRFTKWDVNEKYNLLGLPNEVAYLLAYKDPGAATIKFDHPTWMKALRKSLAGQPHGPIHLPVNWGHTEYNQLVKSDLDPIWDKLGAKFKTHEPVSANNLASEIQAVSDTYCEMLQGKEGQTKKRWDDGEFDFFLMI
jgi:hypothetical protein